MLAPDEANVEGVDLALVADLHGLKVECVNGDDHQFLGFLLDDGGDLLDGVEAALPVAPMRQVETAKLPISLGRFARALANRTMHFVLARAALDALCAGVCG